MRSPIKSDQEDREKKSLEPEVESEAHSHMDKIKFKSAVLMAFLLRNDYPRARALYEQYRAHVNSNMEESHPISALQRVNTDSLDADSRDDDRSIAIETSNPRPFSRTMPQPPRAFTQYSTSATTTTTTATSRYSPLSSFSSMGAGRPDQSAPFGRTGAGMTSRPGSPALSVGTAKTKQVEKRETKKDKEREKDKEKDADPNINEFDESDDAIDIFDSSLKAATKQRTEHESGIGQSAPRQFGAPHFFAPSRVAVKSKPEKKEKEQKTSEDEESASQSNHSWKTLGTFVYDGMIVTFPPGGRFNRETKYRRCQTLGKGGFGTTFRCEIIRDGKITTEPEVIVLKIPDANKEKFSENEAKCHLDTGGFGAIDKKKNIVFAFKAGQTLHNYYSTLDPKSNTTEHFLQICKAIISSVISFHKKGWAHKDIKQDNVVIRFTGGHFEADLIDMGLAEHPLSVDKIKLDIRKLGETLNELYAYRQSLILHSQLLPSAEEAELLGLFKEMQGTTPSLRPELDVVFERISKIESELRQTKVSDARKSDKEEKEDDTSATVSDTVSRRLPSPALKPRLPPLSTNTRSLFGSATLASSHVSTPAQLLKPVADTDDAQQFEFR